MTAYSIEQSGHFGVKMSPRVGTISFTDVSKDGFERKEAYVRFACGRRRTRSVYAMVLLLALKRLRGAQQRLILHFIL